MRNNESNNRSVTQHQNTSKPPVSTYNEEKSILDPRSVCFTLASRGTLRIPIVWSKIVSKGFSDQLSQGPSLGSKKTDASGSSGGSSNVSAVGPVNISFLQDLEKGSTNNSSSQRNQSSVSVSPSRKPLWFVSKDPASHLERSPSPSAVLRHMPAATAAATAATTATATAAGTPSHAGNMSNMASEASGVAVDIQPYVPFLPSDKYARCLDVYIATEVCHSCKDHT